MTSTKSEMYVDVIVKRGRMNSMMQRAMGKVRRARRRDRPAIIARSIREITSACVTLKVR